MNQLQRTLAALAMLSLAATGCSDDADDPTSDALNPSDAISSGDGGPRVDAPPLPPGFDLLIARDWSVPAGSEIYRCTRLTVTEDMYVTGFRALAPLGTHHTVVSIDTTPSAPDGDYDCGAGSISHAMLFASGVGTNELSLPQGVAIPIRAGTQIDLNLHLFNVSDGAIVGTSGTLVEVVPAEEVISEAEVVFGGTYDIFLPSSPGVEQTVSGGCTFQQDATVFALWPHMHQLGRRVLVEHQGAAGTTTLLDTAFSFEEQLNHAITPISVDAGERLKVDCTYINDTGSAVTFGDSSSQEMCFVGIYRYPATGASVFECVGS